MLRNPRGHIAPVQEIWLFVFCTRACVRCSPPQKSESQNQLQNKRRSADAHAFHKRSDFWQGKVYMSEEYKYFLRVGEGFRGLFSYGFFFLTRNTLEMSFSWECKP
jgi:hypothetical protein